MHTGVCTPAHLTHLNIPELAHQAAGSSQRCCSCRVAGVTARYRSSRPRGSYSNIFVHIHNICSEQVRYCKFHISIPQR